MNFQKTTSDYSSLVSLVRNQPYPTYPQYATFTSRLKTYNLFPPTIPQNKYVLSECGFIYTGVQDIVECFSCGLVLHNWKKDDIPWIEHSRHNSKCIYVLLSKGNHFVEHIITKCGRTKCNCETKYATRSTAST
ncbi:death-associated inhibitor of apoptosis 1-like [Acyrthosiphon pisum]|uniref:Uncharacterized protein n=1 Tax=Acyrthosiphon pisum TaxID=7029 RepID=A0A8R2BB98_ACYPI|nr:death-associated inhibitor of apoptosis 1-like [Acyrthosiphon pisum]|eukprot:XP_008189690.1 PREDICTED: death-associated inhibitor of apoptosis 1-like [Acyrthosiphon pisum]